MGVAEQIARLAGRPESAGPVVSVYLNTSWTDEHQRERTRLFLADALRRTRGTGRDGPGAAALDWIEAEGEAVVRQAVHPGARGVALFAGPDLRESVASRVPFENSFTVADRPRLRPLAEVRAVAPALLVVFVDAETARLIPVSLAGAGEEVRLDSEVPGHHRRGGWAQLAQSRYQRHLETRRERHLEAVAEALGRVVEEKPVERIVIAGSAESAAGLRRALRSPVGSLVGAIVPGSRHEPAGQLVTRAAEAIEHVVAREVQGSVEDILTRAAKGGPAAAGLDGVREAVARGAVDRLFLLRAFQEDGRACGACAGLQPGSDPTCRRCGRSTVAVELGEALVAGTLAAGGEVTVVGASPLLARADGVAARLRFTP